MGVSFFALDTNKQPDQKRDEVWLPKAHGLRLEQNSFDRDGEITALWSLILGPEDRTRRVYEFLRQFLI